MSKTKKSVPNDLTKLLVLLSKKLPRKQGIDFRFHRDALDIYLLHSKEKEPIADVIPFKLLKGGKKDV